MRCCVNALYIISISLQSVFILFYYQNLIIIAHESLYACKQSLLKKKNAFKKKESKQASEAGKWEFFIPFFKHWNLYFFFHKRSFLRFIICWFVCHTMVDSAELKECIVLQTKSIAHLAYIYIWNVYQIQPFFLQTHTVSRAHMTHCFALERKQLPSRWL